MPRMSAQVVEPQNAPCPAAPDPGETHDMHNNLFAQTWCGFCGHSWAKLDEILNGDFRTQKRQPKEPVDSPMGVSA